MCISGMLFIQHLCVHRTSYIRSTLYQVGCLFFTTIDNISDCRIAFFSSLDDNKNSYYDITLSILSMYFTCIDFCCLPFVNTFPTKTLSFDLNAHLFYPHFLRNNLILYFFEDRYLS